MRASLRCLCLAVLALLAGTAGAAAQAVDLAVTEVVLRPASPRPGDTVTIAAQVERNDRSGPPALALVRFAVGSRPIAERRVTLAAGGRQTVTATWRAVAGRQTITATIVPAAPRLRDATPANNARSAEATIEVIAAAPRRDAPALPISGPPARPITTATITFAVAPPRAIATTPLTFAVAPPRAIATTPITFAAIMPPPTRTPDDARLIDTAPLVMHLRGAMRDDPRVIDTAPLVMRLRGPTRDDPRVIETEPLVMRRTTNSGGAPTPSDAITTPRR